MGYRYRMTGYVCLLWHATVWVTLKSDVSQLMIDCKPWPKKGGRCHDFGWLAIWVVLQMNSDQMPLRVAMVVEGPTDYLVLQAVVTALIAPRVVAFTYVQPEYSTAFESIGCEGAGWPGVYRWCQSAVDLHGSIGLEDNILFLNHDILVLQIDADVATSNYAAGHIYDLTSDLPCAMPCPPVCDTTFALAQVVLRWLSTSVCPPNVTLCIPAQSLETWIFVGLYPDDKLAISSNLECRHGIDRQLAAKPLGEKLINGSKKNLGMYKKCAQTVANNWAHITSVCSQAQGFEQHLLKSNLLNIP